MNDNIQYTKYFTSCKGVFQGGGCKAIAYIGAYKKAYQRGVFFSELAGTSAGSIIAALIAAGATPNYLEEIVLKLDFQRFISKYNEANCLEKLVAKKVLPQRLSSFNKYFSIKGIILLTSKASLLSFTTKLSIIFPLFIRIYGCSKSSI